MSVLLEICFSFTTLKHAGIGTLVSQMNLGSLYNAAWHRLSFGLKNMFLNKQRFFCGYFKKEGKNIPQILVIAVFFKLLWFCNAWITFLFL